MKEAISRLYAHILLFFQKAVKWYSRSSTGRALSSIFKPFELDHKETVDEIRLCARTIHNIASVASRAELRAINDKLKEQHIQDLERDAKLHEIQTQLKDLNESWHTSNTQIMQIATSELLPLS